MNGDADIKEEVGTGERTLVKNVTKIASKVLKKRKCKDKPPTPDMLSFASIMTILLAFFIMLSSHAGKPENNSAKEAVESFKRATQYFGLSRFINGSSNSIANLSFISTRSAVKSDTERSEVIGRMFSNLVDRKIGLEYVRKGRQLFFTTNIDFIAGGTEFLPSGKAYLDNLIKLIKERDCKITVCSYTGENFVPSSEYTTSWQFTAERSAAVTNYLHNMGNIDYTRMAAIGYGEYQPLLGEEAYFNTDANRRTNIIISNN